MCNRTSSRYHRELVFLFLLLSSFFCAADLSTTSHRFVTNTAHRRHSFSLACRCDTLAHLRVCSTRRADFACSPSSLTCTGEMEDFAPCEESDSRTVLISNARGIERAITARSPSGMSVQPYIPIFVTTLSPSRASRPRQTVYICLYDLVQGHVR